MTGLLAQPADVDGMPAKVSIDLFRALSAGVSVLTSRDADGPVGLTASSVTSLSARPALLLACMNSDARTLRAIRAHRAFAVHLLRDGQQARSTAFAQPGTPQADRFAGEQWDDVLGVPVFKDALAWAVCFLEDERRYGDHSLVVGRLATGRRFAGRPLVWHDRSYWQIGPVSG